MKKYIQQIFVISTLALAITILWIYLTIHRALKKSESPVLTPQETATLDPKLDTSVFQELRQRKK